MDTCSPSGGRGCEEACHQLLMTLGLFPLDLLSPREILRGKERFFSFFFFTRPVSNFTIIVENRSKLVSMEN